MKNDFLQEFHNYVHSAPDFVVLEMERAIKAAKLKFQAVESEVEKFRRGRKPKVNGAADPIPANKTLSGRAPIVDEHGKAL